MASVTQAKPDRPITPKHAWQPFTPRGVTAFAHASGRRLFIVQFIVAAIVVAVCLWFVMSQWLPVLTDSIHALRGESAIQYGQWITTNSAPQRLAGNRRLEIVLDPYHLGGVSGAADLSAILTIRSWRFCGVLGCFELPHERGYTFKISRSELAPAWEAWRQPAIALFGISVVFILFVSWWVLALLATPVVKLIVFFNDRQITWAGSWRMSNAALLPGAFIVVLGIFLYGIAAIDLFQLALFYALHFVCDIAFVATSPLFLPQITTAERAGNPFTPAAEPDGASGPPPKDTNPFRPQ